MIKNLNISPPSILQRVAEPALMLLLLVASAALLVSCDASQDTPDPAPEPEPTEHAIAFAGSQTAMQSSTRTDAGTTTALATLYNTFEVWGYKKNSDGVLQTVFPGYYVEATQDKDDPDKYTWAYTDNAYAYNYNQNTKYWDEFALAYTFFAVAPFNSDSYQSLVVLKDDEDNVVTSTAKATKAVLTFNLDGSDSMVDTNGNLLTTGGKNLLYSDKEYIGTNEAVKDKMDATDATSHVNLSFNQPMAKVRIKFVYPTDILASNVAINNLKFNPVTTDDANDNNYTNTDDKGTSVKATVTVEYPLDGSAISLSSKTSSALDAYVTIKEPYETKAADGDPLPHATNEARWYYVTPVGEQGAYYLEGIFNAKAKTAVVPAEYMNWQAGHEYTYIFKITETSISFAQVIDVYTKWQAGYSQDVNW